jgi:hypothetical protein
MAYYLGGYYLMVPKPIEFGSQAEKIVYTCSDCINDSLLDHWSYGWTTNNDQNIEEIKRLYALTSDQITSIRNWVDEAFEKECVGWIDVFGDLETVQEYRQRFFKNIPDLQILSIYFEEIEAEAIVKEFEPRKEKEGACGLYQNIKIKSLEVASDTESLIGYDIIGVEQSGGFHTFHCHDLAAELTRRFNLEVNGYGLFTAIDNPTEVAKYMNDPDNGFEPVPWFICKTKIVTK